MHPHRVWYDSGRWDFKPDADGAVWIKNVAYREVLIDDIQPVYTAR
jgi:hypothetical protein